VEPGEINRGVPALLRDGENEMCLSSWAVAEADVTMLSPLVMLGIVFLVTRLGLPCLGTTSGIVPADGKLALLLAGVVAAAPSTKAAD
jgi:hypothetical protein